MAKKGEIKDRTGEVNFNKYNSKMTIIEYNGSNDVIIKFNNGYIRKCAYREFKNGSITHGFDRTVEGIGYLGTGKYTVKNKYVYTQWKSMLQRCYSKRELIKRPTYKDVTVCEEWHNFQNFAKWYEENYYCIRNDRMELDKDILHKGNKIYSPETCIFVPKYVNTLFVKNNMTRGEFPIGVSYDKDRNMFSSQCTITKEGKRINKRIGRFNTPIEAFNAYKKFKEQYIKQVADEYKDKIPKKLYDAMYRYEVEITD